jgi:hypothetical protein
MMRWSGSSWDPVTTGRNLLSIVNKLSTAGVNLGIGVWADAPGLLAVIDNGVSISDASIAYSMPIQNVGAAGCNPTTRVLVDGNLLGQATAVTVPSSGISIASQTQIAVGLSPGTHTIKVQALTWQSTCGNVQILVGMVGPTNVTGNLAIMVFPR